MHSFENIIVGILILSFVVFVHEMGHYLAARWRHIQVDVFSIGFGPSLFSWHDRVGTRWQLSLLPLGGYVKLHGFESPVSSDDVDEESFHKKPLLSRAIVTVMGPVFNFILTIVVFSVLFSLYGQPEVKPDIQQVVSGGAADKAGLHVGDHLTRLNGHDVLGAADLQAQIMAHPGEKVTVGLMRQGKELDIPVTLDAVTEGKRQIGRLDIGFAISPGHALPIYKAIPHAFTQTGKLCVDQLKAIWQIVSGQRSAKQLSGTIGIIQASGQVVHYGLASLLFFVAMISASLGLFNLFPIPMLDGGHLVMYAFEAVRGRPVPEQVQGYALQIGLTLVLALFLFTGYNDLGRLGLFRWLFSGN
ncbi:RIP metalloprotease RseP [Saccharibacter sp. 17.LH.SD]|uniref:RIP metalloprotease RseP n=1 Tax=Saccharibacter sp. 17.LH.SD TaxID=2689393 RepID=UPI0013699602|nr:RIP metalloprotease RseP [Saccharibacter sp. 17.LH.SD]MXV44095.1 RIP metalloprotease RseP [Saccharibacter sp. 17.LH.SD]